MDDSLKLFLLGLALGIGVTVSIDLLEDNTNSFQSLVSGAFKLWHLLFMIIMITTVPFLAIEPLKKRFTRKNLLPFQFLAGNSTGFLFMAISGIIVSLVT